MEYVLSSVAPRSTLVLHIHLTSERCRSNLILLWPSLSAPLPSRRAVYWCNPAHALPAACSGMWYFASSLSSCYLAYGADSKIWLSHLMIPAHQDVAAVRGGHTSD